MQVYVVIRIYNEGIGKDDKIVKIFDSWAKANNYVISQRGINPVQVWCHNIEEHEVETE